MLESSFALCHDEYLSWLRNSKYIWLSSLAYMTAQLMWASFRVAWLIHGDWFPRDSVLRGVKAEVAVLLRPGLRRCTPSLPSHSAGQRQTKKKNISTAHFWVVVGVWWQKFIINFHKLLNKYIMKIIILEIIGNLNNMLKEHPVFQGKAEPKSLPSKYRLIIFKDSKLYKYLTLLRVSHSSSHIRLPDLANKIISCNT